MANFRCKMCGGTIEFSPGATVGVCDSCGTRQTLPRLTDDRKNTLLERANAYRKNGEFDKAEALYDQLLNDGAEDAEIYWSLVLCRYGIQYVKDPGSGLRVPTVNRAQYTPVHADPDYKKALAAADDASRELYEAEAAQIDGIQKGILALSQKEEPFDVFICYKETDEMGRRTRDSVLANELYHALIGEGFKVFYARITLEDKLGSAYEPYIFAALNSAAVMVVLGTKPEYFNAPWVRNEWSRFLLLIKQGKKKMLIPAYRDMDPYDLPEEFATLQAQDMSKLGFVQDLVRGIQKIAGQTAARPSFNEPSSPLTADAAGTASALLDRGYLALEDEDYRAADEFFDSALNFDARCAKAYFGKFLASRKISNPDRLNKTSFPVAEDKNYQKALRFADPAFAEELKGYTETIERNIQKARELENEKNYQIALDALNNAKRQGTTEAFEFASTLFQKLGNYKESEHLAAECRIEVKRILYATAETLYKKAEQTLIVQTLRQAAACYDKCEDYQDAKARAEACKAEIPKMEKYRHARNMLANSLASSGTSRSAIAILREMPDYRDARQLIANWEATLEKERAFRKKAKKVALIALPSIAVIIAFLIFLFNFLIPETKYRNATAAYRKEDYVTAHRLFSELSEKEYRNSDVWLDATETAILSTAETIWKEEGEEQAQFYLNNFSSFSYAAWSSEDFSKARNSGKGIVIIPPGTAEIPDYAFLYATGIQRVLIPSSVKKIGTSAFSGCTGLTDITIPDSVTNIGSYAFRGCSGLTSVTIPDSVKNIGSYAFKGCSGLTDITIPDSVTSVGSDAFSGCSSLESITIPFVGAVAGKTASDTYQYPFGYIFGTTAFTGGTSVKQYYYSSTSFTTSSTYYIPYYIPSSLRSVTVTGGNILRGAFQDCSMLTSVTFGNGVTSIGSSAFSGCTGLTGVTFGNGVTNIGNEAFDGCSGLTSVTIPDSVTSIGWKAFSGCTGLTSVTIPNGVTSIGSSAFEGCTGLTNVTIPDSVTSIRMGAFENCTGLTSITIPDSVTSIETSAFYGCSGLTSVTIGNGVTSIGSSAFNGCSMLTDIHYGGTVAQWRSIDKASGWNQLTGTYTVHCTDGDILKSYS